MGGNAFKGTVPLQQHRAERIVGLLRSLTGWTLEPVGSFGMRAEMPDLDLIVPDRQFSVEALRALNIGAVRLYTLGGAGLEFALDGLTHQVDFFPVVSLAWGRFSRAGAEDSGALRAVLLKAAASTFIERGIDNVLWRGDRAVIRAGRTLDQRKGLRRIFQHSFRKDGNGLLANAKTVTESEFVTFLAGRRLSNPPRFQPVPTITDPSIVRKMILGTDDPEVDRSAASLAAFMSETFDPLRLARTKAKMVERGFEFPRAARALRG